MSVCAREIGKESGMQIMSIAYIFYGVKLPIKDVADIRFRASDRRMCTKCNIMADHKFKFCPECEQPVSKALQLHTDVFYGEGEAKNEHCCLIGLDSSSDSNNGFFLAVNESLQSISNEDWEAQQLNTTMICGNILKYASWNLWLQEFAKSLGVGSVCNVYWQLAVESVY